MICCDCRVAAGYNAHDQEAARSLHDRCVNNRRLQVNKAGHPTGNLVPTTTTWCDCQCKTGKWVADGERTGR